MKEIAIIDYGMCNMDSVSRALEKCGAMPIVTSDPLEVQEACGVILPGVGSFANAMGELKDRNLVDTVRQQVLENNIPFLGICLGMQLMASSGYEGGYCNGLDLIKGEVQQLTATSENVRVPHVGWNEVELPKNNSPLFNRVKNNTDFYFVHSYHFECESKYIVGTTNYCGGFISAISHKNCYGVQFHPEKSLKAGIQLLDNFIELC